MGNLQRAVHRELLDQPCIWEGGRLEADETFKRPPNIVTRQARNGEKKEQIKKQMKQGKGLVWTDSDMPRIRG